MARYFTSDHEWLDVTDDLGTLGITAYAAEQLGDVVYVELRDPGARFEAGDEIGVVESVKAASEIFAPVAGEILEANSDLAENPALVGENPEGGAWFYRIRIADTGALKGLMDKAAYDASIG